MMVGKVGGDVFGPQLLEGLSGAGVDISGISKNASVSSGIAVIGIDETDQNCITQILGANDTCGPEQVSTVKRELSGAAGLLLQLETSISLSVEVAQEASLLGVTVMLDPGPVRPVPDTLLTLCDVITPNETEAQALVGFPVSGPESAAEAASVLLERGVRAVVIKLGSQGAYFADNTRNGLVLPFQVDAVDSVAAGDAFNGALAVSLAEGRTLEEGVIIACACLLYTSPSPRA